MYYSFTITFNIEFARFTIVSPTYTQEAGYLIKSITTASKNLSALLLLFTLDLDLPIFTPVGIKQSPITFIEITIKGAISALIFRSTSCSSYSYSNAIIYTLSPAYKTPPSPQKGRIFFCFNYNSLFININVFVIRKEV